MNALATTTVRKNLLEREGYTPYCGEALMCTAGLPRTTWDGTQFRCRCGWRSEFPADFIAAYKAKWGIPSEASTQPDFFAAMAVGIPPITPPTRIGLDLATGSDTTVVAEVAADGTITRMATIPQEQSPMTELKAFYVDDMPTIYAAESIEHAAELYENDCGEAPADGYPYQASEQDLDMPVPETDEDEQPTGVMTTMRAWLAEAEPGFLCGAE